MFFRYHYSDQDVKQISKKLARDTTYKGVNPDYIFDDLAILSDFKLFQILEKHKVYFDLEPFNPRNYFK